MEDKVWKKLSTTALSQQSPFGEKARTHEDQEELPLK